MSSLERSHVQLNLVKNIILNLTEVDHTVQGFMRQRADKCQTPDWAVVRDNSHHHLKATDVVLYVRSSVILFEIWDLEIRSGRVVSYFSCERSLFRVCRLDFLVGANCIQLFSEVRNLLLGLVKSLTVLIFTS